LRRIVWTEEAVAHLEAIVDYITLAALGFARRLPVGSVNYNNFWRP
jgi:plasmid stabilization system protein ParE